jgi:hypothetical protein
MPCKKAELVSAINSYATARGTGDANLINAAAAMLQPLVDSLEYAPEQAEAVTDISPEITEEAD